MAAWHDFPYDNGAYTYKLASLKKHWARLHAGDAEPWPDDKAVQQAWISFHAGLFQRAFDAGLAAGDAGITVANKAQAIYATYLERSEHAKQTHFLEVAKRAEAQTHTTPQAANAHYWLAYALGRYSQSISVAKALSQGLGVRVKAALETTLQLAPQHADAHTALGMFHAEVIDKVGHLLGKTQGADADTGLALFAQGLKLNPDSAIARIEYANGLVMLEGEKQMALAERLYAEAAQTKPMDAMERLDMELAKAELAA